MADEQGESLGAEWAPGGWTSNIEELLACIATVIVVFATSWGVFTRYVTAQSATWSAEIAAAGFCWMIFFGGAAVFKRGAHVSIDMAVAQLSPGPRKLVAIAVDLLVLAFLACVSWLAIVYSVDSWDNPMPSLRWPYTIHYAGAALGLGAMTLRHAQSALRRRHAAR